MPSDGPGRIGRAVNCISKIIFILRTRNIYGYNSTCERLLGLLIGSGRPQVRA
jgi:hypothetical protein